MQFRLKARLLGIATEGSLVVLLGKEVMRANDLRTGDRVLLSVQGGTPIIATTNAAHNGYILHDDEIGLFVETERALDARSGMVVEVLVAPRAECINLIKKKMAGKKLSYDEHHAIVKDIVSRELTDVELAYFVAACTMHPLTFDETVALTKAMIATGSTLRFDSPKQPLVIDKHCIGGVPGNRTTLLTVPIMASFGITIPKTSSRAITSPAGTADTMEVFADVSLSIDKMRSVVGSAGACIVWGGGINLAPADDRLIRIERPLSIDVSELMLASVMAIKASVSPTHVLIDIPYGQGAKVETLDRAKELKRQFQAIAAELNLRILVLMTDGSQPIGNGVGPLLEAYDVLAVLKNDPAAPSDLRDKAIHLAGMMLEFVGTAPKGKGKSMAADAITSGRALHKFNEIIDAQGRKELPPLGRLTHDVLAQRTGTIISIDNLSVARIAHAAGAPGTPNAGLLLFTKVGHAVTVGDKLYTIYADNEEKFARAIQQASIDDPFTVR